ncbi:hypothetical protein THAOC_28127, partial [Thalassiosira oceanica]
LLPRGHALLASPYTLPPCPLLRAVRAIRQLANARAADLHDASMNWREIREMLEGETPKGSNQDPFSCGSRSVLVVCAWHCRATVSHGGREEASGLGNQRERRMPLKGIAPPPRRRPPPCCHLAAPTPHLLRSASGLFGPAAEKPARKTARLLIPPEFPGIPLHSFLWDFKGTESGFSFPGTQKGTRRKIPSVIKSYEIVNRVARPPGLGHQAHQAEQHAKLRQAQAAAGYGKNSSPPMELENMRAKAVLARLEPRSSIVNQSASTAAGRLNLIEYPVQAGRQQPLPHPGEGGGLTRRARPLSTVSLASPSPHAADGSQRLFR